MKIGYKIIFVGAFLMLLNDSFAAGSSDDSWANRQARSAHEQKEIAQLRVKALRETPEWKKIVTFIPVTTAITIDGKQYPIERFLVAPGPYEIDPTEMKQLVARNQMGVDRVFRKDIQYLAHEILKSKSAAIDSDEVARLCEDIHNKTNIDYLPALQALEEQNKLNAELKKAAALKILAALKKAVALKKVAKEPNYAMFGFSPAEIDFLASFWMFFSHKNKVDRPNKITYLKA